MRIIDWFINILRRIFGTASAAEIDSVEIWEEHPDHFKFRYGTQTWGDFGSYEAARKVAEDYNFLTINSKKIEG